MKQIYGPENYVLFNLSKEEMGFMCPDPNRNTGPAGHYRGVEK